MNLYQLNQATPEQQLAHVLARGTYLAQRWESEFVGLNLYFLPDTWIGYFVEVGIDEVAECILVLRCFSSSVPLEDYTHGVGLP